MTPEQEWEREASRLRRWHRISIAFAAICAAAVAVFGLAFDLVREWWIWNR